MSTLIQLPAEILLTISDNIVDPEDIDAFSLTCKHIRCTAAPTLVKHKTLRSIHSTRECSDSHKQDSLTNLLLAILEEPQIGLYVRCLVIDGCHKHWCDNEEDHDIHKPMPSSLVATVDKRYQETYGIPAIGDSIELLSERGNEGCVILLLLHMLPKLEVLEVREALRPCLLNSIICSLHANIEKNADSPTLRRLKKFVYSVQFSTEDDDRSLECTRRMALLPSMHSLTIRGIIELDEKEESRLETTPNTSFVADLVVGGSCINSKRLSKFLRPFRSLKRFEWDALGCVGDNECGDHCDPFWICLALQRFSAHSLEELIIESFARKVCPDSPFKARFVDDISDFTCLKYLEVGIRHLVEETTNRKINLVKLPASLQCLYVHGDETSHENFLSLLEMVAYAKSECGLSLTTLRAHFWFGDWSAYENIIDQTFQSLLQRCRDTGIDANVEVDNVGTGEVHILD